jgi:hypothetical protein
MGFAVFYEDLVLQVPFRDRPRRYTAGSGCTSFPSTTQSGTSGAFTSGALASSLTFDFSRTLVGGLGPDEGWQRSFPAVDEGADLDHEVSDGGEAAAVDGLAFDDGEPRRGGGSQELLVPVPVLAHPGDLPGRDLQCCEQGGGAVPDVIVGALLDVAGATSAGSSG